ncbi:unnamed protein product, partial [Iphiclides podalirius]
MLCRNTSYWWLIDSENSQCSIQFDTVLFGGTLNAVVGWRGAKMKNEPSAQAYRNRASRRPYQCRGDRSLHCLRLPPSAAD